MGPPRNHSSIGLGLSSGALAFGTLKPQKSSLKIPKANRKIIAAPEVPRISMQERFGVSVHGDRSPREPLTCMFSDPLIQVKAGIRKALGDGSDTLRPTEREETPVVVIRVFCCGQSGLTSLADLSREFTGQRTQTKIAEILHPEKILSDALQRRPAVTGGCNRRLSHQVTVRIFAPLLGNIGAQVVVNELKGVKPLCLLGKRFGEDISYCSKVSTLIMSKCSASNCCFSQPKLMFWVRSVWRIFSLSPLLTIVMVA